VTDKRYQVFISSTYDDLKEERLEVLNSLLEINCIPVGMELFPSSSTEQFDYIKRLIDDSDYYVVIIAGRYGTLAENKRSYTENEFDYALEKKVPILAFIHSQPGSLEAWRVDAEHKKELDDFRTKAKTGRLVKYWTTSTDLAKKVVTALHNAFDKKDRIGWIRADQLNTLRDEYEILTSSKNRAYFAEKLALEKQIVEQKANIAELRIQLRNAKAISHAKGQAHAKEMARLMKDLAGAQKSPASSLAPYKKSKFVSKGEWTNLYQGFGGLDWLVLNVDKQNKRALLIAKDIVETRAYNTGGGETTWAKCSLRKYLNGEEFRKRFSTEEWERISETENANLDNPWYAEGKGGDGTKDKVFLLSIAEAVKYFGGSKVLRNKSLASMYNDSGIDEGNNEKRAVKSRDNGIWWLRSPGNTERTAANVDNDGGISLGGLGILTDGGVRPALWLNL